MKQISFKKVSIKNFLSIGKDPIFIDFQKGITVITGENKDKGGKNGIGKSTIADAIFWCLFGNTIRELKKDKIQHNKNKEECQVILEFNVKDSLITEYKITRTLDPTKIEILCNGQDITLSTLPKNDEFIKILIGANEEVFNNAVIMSANNTVPFMAQKKTDKRKFIEGILQLNIFSEMLLKTRSDYNDTKKENDSLSGNFINEQKNLTIFEEQKEKGEENKKNKIKEFENKIKENKNEIEKIKKDKIDSLENLKDKKTKYSEKLNLLDKACKKHISECNNLTNIQIKKQSEIQQKEKEKKSLLDKGNSCPTCNRQYCQDDISLINQKVKDIDDDLNKLKKEIEILSKKEKENEKLYGDICNGISKLKDNIKNVEEEISKERINQQKIENIEDKIKEYEEYIKNIQNEKQDYDVNIKNTKDKIEKIEKQLKEVKKHLQILDSVKFIVSEGGVKTYIVKKIIDILNKKLNHYLQKLDTPCKCVFDEMFEETIYNEEGKECSYFNFSGGERKRIDTAILFTFQDVMRFHSGTSFSLNIYDELFDCALDVKGTDKILEILKEKIEKYDESIYIVSHKHSDISNIDNVIFLEKNNGVTSIVS